MSPKVVANHTPTHCESSVFRVDVKLCRCDSRLYVADKQSGHELILIQSTEFFDTMLSFPGYEGLGLWLHEKGSTHAVASIGLLAVFAVPMST